MIEAGAVRCGRCQRPIPVDAPGGLCPNCLFASQLVGNFSTLAEGWVDPQAAPTAADFGASPSSLVNTDLGPHRLLAEIGRGGMGIVYRARHQQLARNVAIKMILAGCATDPRRLNAFLSEARAVARIRHPNIVGIYEVGEREPADSLRGK